MMTVEQANAIHATKFVKAETAQRRWLRFFGVLLPLVFVAFALVAEGLAYELRGIQPFRTSLDKSWWQLNVFRATRNGLSSAIA